MPSNVDTEQFRPDPESWDPVCFLAARKPSAVAIIIFESELDGPHVLLTRRSTRLNSHKGQIGFPGGRLESSDRRPRDTALREASEEVGLDPERVTILGGVDPLPALDGSLVFPVIGVTDAAIEDLKINPAEVAGIYMIPVEKLMSGNKKRFSFNLFGCWRHSFLYDCGAISVWGLSAEILARINFRAPNF